VLTVFKKKNLKKISVAVVKKKVTHCEIILTNIVVMKRSNFYANLDEEHRSLLSAFIAVQPKPVKMRPPSWDQLPVNIAKDIFCLWNGMESRRYYKRMMSAMLCYEMSKVKIYTRNCECGGVIRRWYKSHDMEIVFIAEYMSGECSNVLWKYIENKKVVY